MGSWDLSGCDVEDMNSSETEHTWHQGAPANGSATGPAPTAAHAQPPAQAPGASSWLTNLWGGPQEQAPNVPNAAVQSKQVVSEWYPAGERPSGGPSEDPRLSLCSVDCPGDLQTGSPALKKDLSRTAAAVAPPTGAPTETVGIATATAPRRSFQPR